MAKKLWDYFGGEPFMENPHLAIIGNPFKVGSIIERKKQGFRKISQRKGTKVMAYKRGRKNSPKRKRARKNPFPGGGLMINRPRRKHRKNPRVYHMRKNRRGVYTHNPKRRHRRHRSNPAFLGVTLPPVTMLAWGAAGFVGTPMVESYLNRFIPAEVTSNVLGRYAVKIGTVLGLTYLAKRFIGQSVAFPIAMGGGMYVISSAINEFVPQLTMTTPTQLPAPVKAYRSGMIKAYRSGMISSGIGGYAATNLANGRMALPGLAQPSTMMPRFDLDSPGMKNPVFADPRFTASPMVAR